MIILPDFLPLCENQMENDMATWIIGVRYGLLPAANHQVTHTHTHILPRWLHDVMERLVDPGDRGLRVPKPCMDNGGKFFSKPAVDGVKQP